MSLHWCCFVCLFLLVGLRAEVANAQFYRNVGNKHLPYWSIVVDQSGHGNFSTIQSAIDSVPSNNRYWVSIKVKAGTYREKVKIPYDKPFIILKGEGKRRTLVEWDDHNDISQSPTFAAMADNLVVKCMSFRNSYNNPINNKHENVPAVAAMVSGDKAYFFRVGFFGVQDTLWDVAGRHYYMLCTMQGAVDFIFGAAQSLFERCSISVIGGALAPGLSGFITAQGRENSQDANGFVFKDCHVFGSGSSYLGRPWRSYARVLFYNTTMTNVVQPSGWTSSDFAGYDVKIVLVHANHNHHHHHHHEQRNNKQIANKTSHSSSGTIIVDLSGNGDFSTIQSAIDSISSDNKNWVYIYVKAGTYREKVKISFDKPFIVLEGEGQKNTFVEWDDHDSSAESPTFTTMADNVVVKSISFRDCTISAIDANLGPGIIGFITAQGRTDPNDSNGFVFKQCNIIGNGTTYLGRPWRGYARVIFYNTKMSNIIQPLGWQPWGFAGQEDHITFAEYGNSGPGSDTSKRVSWLKNLDSSTVSKMASTSFIGTDGWLKTLTQL
ncbi:hypothetical protein JHK86_003556 [Glycine max]|nr:hypothetical protein JHK86_003556 [Glycine max]